MIRRRDREERRQNQNGQNTQNGQGQGKQNGQNKQSAQNSQGGKKNKKNRHENRNREPQPSVSKEELTELKVADLRARAADEKLGNQTRETIYRNQSVSALFLFALRYLYRPLSARHFSRSHRYPAGLFFEKTTS